MGTIKYSGLVLGIKGSIAGTTFQGGRAGNTIKSKQFNVKRKFALAIGSRPVRPKSAMQQITQHWRTMGEDYRASWVTAAPSFPFINKWGDTYTGSGFQLYVSLTLNLVYYGTPISNTAPSPYTFDVFSVTGVEDIDADDVNIDIVGSANDAVVIEVMATNGISRGSQSPRGGFKFIGFFPTIDTGVLDVTTEYFARFPHPNNNTRVGFKLRLVNIHTGEATAWQYTAGHVVL